jgi:hypothetical protein
MKPRYIAHTGGEQPVADDTLVECAFSDEAIAGAGPARMWRWDKIGNETDIIAYRVIEQE